MTEDEGMAFARLFSQRREELDLSVVDIAVQTGRPIEVVVAWEQGMSVPDAGDLPEVSQILRLPHPLLEEASRRVAAHQQNTPPPSDVPSPEPDDTGQLSISFEEEPAADDPPDDGSADIFATDDRPSVVSYLDSVVTRMRESITRRRLRARTPAARPSYLEDRDELITYRLRMVLTAAGVGVLALVLRWSLGGLGSAVADLWEALTAAL